MSPVFTNPVPAVTMLPTTLFPMHAGFSPALMAPVFPPTMAALTIGISSYREDNGYEPNDRYPYHIIDRLLRGERFDVEDREFEVVDVKIHQVAHPVAQYQIGDVEMNARLLIAPIAAAVAAFPYIGKGAGKEAKKVKDTADGVATEAMRAAFNNRSIKGTIRGGEGGGRDGMARSGALYLGEMVGTGYGLPVDFLVDPLEVTNATKALDATGAYGKVGQGYAADLVDPAKWFPGYSGASSLMLAVDARQRGTRALSDFLYLDKLQVPYRVARHLPAKGATIAVDPKEFVNTVSAALRMPPSELRAAALARSRHLTTMKGWIDAGIEPWNISTPSDGDAMFTPALAAGALHFAGLTGGVMEGAISAAIGIPLGIRTYMQFVSHDKLGEEEENADLRNPDHRFGFSDEEYAEMLLTKLFDGEHIGHTLRNVNQRGQIAQQIKNAAFAALNDGIFSEDTYTRLLERYAKISADPDNGERFTDRERDFLKQVLTEGGFLDVRRVLRFSDLVASRGWLAAVSAITPNKWAPLEGIRENNHRLTVDTLVAGGSNAVYVLETEVEER